jgi:hypothetical protein
MRRPLQQAIWALAFAAVTASRGGATDLTEARWLSPDADVLTFLMTSPGECVGKYAARNETLEIGRAVFRSPMLLGGQAARSGLSCNACHRDGRDNAAFFVPSLSDKPGAADVTSALFSDRREDGVFNPVAIPSLVGTANKAVFGTIRPTRDLRHFISSAVSEEFQGERPSRRMMDGLEAYISAFNERDCPARAAPRSPDRDLNDVRRTIRAAIAAIGESDAATADFLLASAQQRLGLIHERYSDPALTKERRALAALSERLGQLRSQVSDGGTGALKELSRLDAETGRLSAVLDERKALSLYDPVVLKRALEGG